MPTHYQLLNIDKGADIAEVRAAYKALIKRHHPDASGGDPEMATRLNEAYRVLSNARRRADYDRSINPAPAQRARAQRAPFQQSPPNFDFFQMGGGGSGAPEQRRAAPLQGMEPGRDGFLGQKPGRNKAAMALAALCALAPAGFIYFAGPLFFAPGPGDLPAPPQAPVNVDQSAPGDRPGTGVMSSPEGVPRVARLVVTAGAGADQYLKLVEAGSGREAMTLYVREGQTLQTRAPLGRYRLRYASGQRWGGTQLLFGPETRVAAATDILDFGTEGAVRAYELTLGSAEDGNQAGRAIPRAEF